MQRAGHTPQREFLTQASSFNTKNTKQLNNAEPGSGDPPYSSFDSIDNDCSKALRFLNISSTDSLGERASLASSVSSNYNCDENLGVSKALQNSGTLVDTFDAIAFSKRLFANKQNTGTTDFMGSIKCHEFWMSVQINDVLLVEVGHAVMAGGKDQFVELVDEQFDDPSVNQIIVYFSKHRSDFKQLVNSFEIMDLERISPASVSFEVGLELNNSNYFMKLATDYDSNSGDSDCSDDLIDLN